MQNIHVGRYQHPDSVKYDGWIEPEDRSWVLFIKPDAPPELLIQVETEDDDGKTIHGYIAAEDFPDGAEAPQQS